MQQMLKPEAPNEPAGGPKKRGKKPKPGLAG
jgi:hypothetical protein